MDRPTLLLLIRKYLDGTATSEEHTFIETWYRKMDSNRSIESILSEPEIHRLEQQIFENIRVRIDLPASAPAALPHRSAPVRTLVRYIAVAASLIFVVTGSWLLYRHYNNSTPQYTTIYAQRGKVRKLTLSDGSQVWLNADSKLRFAKDFGGTASREIFLEGEAYFEVTHDEQHPFLVHTQTLTTRVLGTRFNVKAYGDNHNIEVTLLEGKVMLSAPSPHPGNEADTLYLDPNEKAVFADRRLQRADLALAGTSKRDSLHQPAHTRPGNASTPLTLIREAVSDAEGSIAWRTGGLVFDHASLDNVMDALSRKYNIHIHADSLLLDQPVTVTILPSDSAEGALLEITRRLKRGPDHVHDPGSESVQYRREGSVYYIE